jgi:hypothetical protein
MNRIYITRDKEGWISTGEGLGFGLLFLSRRVFTLTLISVVRVCDRGYYCICRRLKKIMYSFVSLSGLSPRFYLIRLPWVRGTFKFKDDHSKIRMDQGRDERRVSSARGSGPQDGVKQDTFVIRASVQKLDK